VPQPEYVEERPGRSSSGPLMVEDGGHDYLPIEINSVGVKDAAAAVQVCGVLCVCRRCPGWTAGHWG
jgi:hypothetical protein